MPLARYLRRHHLGILLLVLLLTTGSAYAAGTIAKNSVGTKEVKNNSLKSVDVKQRSLNGADLKPGAVGGTQVRNGSIGTKELVPGTVAETQLVTKQMASGAGPVEFFNRPDVGKLTFSCNGLSFSANFTVPATAVPASAYVNGSDIANEDGIVGAAGISAPAGSLGGGVGFGGTGIIPEGDFWVVTADETLHVQWIAQGGCTVRAHLTIDRVPGAGPAFRQIASARPATCGPVTGAANCQVR